jgi:hypothetical protein
MVFYYQMIYSPERNNTIKHDSCYNVDVVTNPQRTMIHTLLCINVAWCCGEPVPYVLRHFVLSILLHCLMPTVRPFPLLAGRVS